MVCGVHDGCREHGVEALALTVQSLQCHHVRLPGHANHSGSVIPNRGNCSSDVRSMAMVVGRVVVVRYKIPTSREKALSTLVEAIQPKKSHTFRSGKTGGWKQYFTDEHKKLFNDVAGDLLINLGYETSRNW